MRVLVISDIHANLTALDTVLTDASPYDAVWCLGDLVGYGPDPNECIERVRGLPKLLCVLGNHDAAALRQIDSGSFNPEARRALHWTQDALTRDNLIFLKNLPERICVENVTLVHGSPRQPVWEYLLDTHNATRSFEYFDTDYCFIGHTHLPILYHLRNGEQMARLLLPDAQMKLRLTKRVIINPGSVGQPRDRDPRASYAIYDPNEHTWIFNRVSYDFNAVQERMVAAGLPDRHIQRLAAGW